MMTSLPSSPLALRAARELGWVGKINEFARAVVPLAIFIVVYCGLVTGDWFISWPITGGLCCVIVGLALFKAGLVGGLMPFAEIIGERLPEKQTDAGMIVTTTLLGIVVTFAEPSISSLQTIAGYVSHPRPLLACIVKGHPTALLTSIALGVGIAAGAGMLRIRHGWSLLTLLKGLVPVLLLLTAMCPEDIRGIIPLAWDAGAITTGPATVPIVLALGAGVAEDVASHGTAGHESDLKGFGVVTLASLVPVVTVLMCGVLMIDSGDVVNYLHEVKHGELPPPTVPANLQELVLMKAKEAAHSLGPLMFYLLLVQFAVIREKLPNPRSFVIGVILTFVGLTIFNVGLTFGSVPLGDRAGQVLPAVLRPSFFGPKLGAAMIVLFGFVGGLIATFIDLEPCGLGERVEKLTHGKIKKMHLFLAVALGAGFGVGLGLARLIFQFSLIYILVVGYMFALVLSCYCDEGVVCIAWDAAGVTTGPVTVPLVLSVGVGIAGEVGAADGFGMLATTALFPIIGVLSLGIVKMGRNGLTPKKLKELAAANGSTNGSTLA